MRLIEKIILLLLGIALLPLLMTGTLLYLTARHNIEQQTKDNLNSIATIQEHRISDLRSQNLIQLADFTGRLQLRVSLDQYNHGHLSADQAKVNAILDEAKKSDPRFARLSVMNPTGVVVASTDRSQIGTDWSSSTQFALADKNSGIKLIGQGDKQVPLFYMSGPLVLNGQSIGVIGIEMSADQLLSIVHDYTGLGSTGETILAQKLPSGQANYVTPLRFDSQAAFSLNITNSSSPIYKAMMGQSTTIANTRDYRGQPVVAATRYISDSGWGLVVKIDRSEAFQASIQFGSVFLLLAFISSVIVVFMAIVLAQHATQPILDIDEVAEQVSRGKLLGRVQHITHDEIGNLATTFNTMLDNLEDLDRAKSDFVSLASHQLRTPATGVKALIGLMLKDYHKELTPSQRSYLERAFDSNERQLRVINDLLNVAMLESGKLQVKKVSVNIGQLIDDTVAEQRSIVESRQQKIHVDQPTKPLMVMADGEKLRMVFDNLVSNASKYTPDGGSINISLRKKESTAMIAVTDTGVGIEEKDIKKLFQKFSQIDNHLNHPGGGSAGLGLYLAKRIVELHDGQITVESRPGKGTTFTVVIPHRAA